MLNKKMNIIQTGDRTVEFSVNGNLYVSDSCNVKMNIREF